MRARLPSRLAGGLERWRRRAVRVEPAPIVLRQRRIFVLPTAAGLAFALALLVMLLASINYHLSLGYALVFLLAGVAVASIVHAVRNLLHLSIRPGRVEPAFVGETARFSLLVTNPRAARRPALRLSAHDARVDFELAADETAEVVLPCTAPRRGRLPLGRVVLETIYPLGLVRAWSVLVPEAACLVYPAPERPAPALPEAAADDAGQRRGQSGQDDFAGLRAHQFADSPRHVAWKVVARGGPLLTKQFAGFTGGKLLLDWDALPPAMDTEDRLRRLTAWVLAAEAAARPFGLGLPQHAVAAGAGPAHARACLERLAFFGLAADRHG